MFRIDIEEGSRESRMPLIGYGRIRSLPSLDEVYATVRVFGYRLFVAAGRYYPKAIDRIDGRRRLRWWLRRAV
jgi:hypothetical protein